MRDNLAVYTSSGCNYPSYLSINLEGDEVEITVRSEPSQPHHGEYLICGDTASMRMPKEDFSKLMLNMLQRFVRPTGTDV